MKSKLFNTLLRVLILLAGAGAGAALAFLCIQVHALTNEDPVALGTLILLYGGMGAMGALLAHLATPPILRWWHAAMQALEKRLDALTTVQLVSMVVWLMGSLMIAALMNQILSFLGDSMLAMALSAICYVVMGVLGLTIGARRADDLEALLSGRAKSAVRNVKMLDESVLCDGRLVPFIRTGAIEGELATTDVVRDALTEAAESPDTARKARALRGLDALRQLPEITVHQIGPSADGDVALMTLARELGAALITTDPLMHKAARVAGLRSINLNDVALSLRTVTAAGDVLTVRISKEGRENGQGVGYLDDGTMVVVEDARSLIGQTVQATVASVLQTSAGRMVFAKLG